MTHCAGEVVPKSPLYDMFTEVPPRYDLINRLVTFGLDRRWRHRAARECLATRPKRVLDLGCGTGDLSLEIASMAGDKIEMVGLDYSQPMLDIAVKKAGRSSNRPRFARGDATALPFSDGYFDCIGISFAFRNLTYKNPHMTLYLAEAWRVLRPEGRFVIVESSQPEAGLIRHLYHLYLRWFVRPVGSLLSGNRGAYRYLAESASRFYSPGQLAEILSAAGFRRESYRPLLLGAVGMHVAVKQ